MNLRLPEGFFDTKPVHKIGALFESEHANLHQLYFSDASGAAPLHQTFERSGILIDTVALALGMSSTLVYRAFIVVWERAGGRWRVYRRTMSFKFDLAVSPLQPGDSVAVPRDLLPVLADEFFDALFQSGCCELVPSPTRLDLLQFV